MSGSRRLRRAVLALALLMPATAWAGDPVTACRKAIAKAGTGLVRSVMTAEQACLLRLAQGKVAAGARCSAAGWSTDGVTDPKTHDKIVAAIARAQASVHKRCAAVDVASAPPAGLGLLPTCTPTDRTCMDIVVDDEPALLDCLACAHVSAAHALLAMEYPGSTDPAPAPTGSLLHVSETAGADTAGCGAAEAPCRSIQFAVDEADAGAEILVAEGTYGYDAGLDTCVQHTGTEAVVCILNKSLTIRGGFAADDWSHADPGLHETVIDGGDARRGVLVQRLSPSAQAVTFDGLTITRGRVQGAPSGGDAATFAFGGGMLVDLSTAVLRNMTFTDNRALGGNTTSSYGGAAAGGGLALRGSPAGTTLEHLTFAGNRAEGGSGGSRGGFGIGGGLYTFDTVVTADDLTFTDNQATGGSTAGNGVVGGERGDGQGGGAAFHEGSDATIGHVVATGNQATGGNAATDAGGAFGGGLYVERSTLVVADADVTGNVALGADGANGGIGAGGGVMAQDSVVTIDRTRIADNRSTGGDGSVNRGSGGGGGAYLSRFGASGSTTVRNSVIAANLTEMGATGTPPGGGGGGLFIQGLPVTIDHATVAGNRLGSSSMAGTGIVLLTGSVGANATISYSIIAQHTTPAGPAALHVMPGSAVTLVRGIFSGNGRDTNANGVPGAAGTFDGLATMLTFGSLDFIAPGAPSFDYHIAPTSPAVDQATGSTATVDVDGMPRTGTPDVGADEAS